MMYLKWRHLLTACCALSLAAFSQQCAFAQDSKDKPPEKKKEVPRDNPESRERRERDEKNRNQSRENEERERAERDRNEKRRAIENELREIQEQLTLRERESQELRQQAEKLRGRMREMGAPGQERREERREMRVEIRKADGPGGETRMEGFFIGPDGKREEIRGFGGPGAMGPGGPHMMLFANPVPLGPPGPIGPGGPPAKRGMEERLNKLEKNVERLLDQMERLNRSPEKRRD
jgi:flagellar biosynthesis GTPase FlhF